MIVTLFTFSFAFLTARGNLFKCFGNKNLQIFFMPTNRLKTKTES